MNSLRERTRRPSAVVVVILTMAVALLAAPLAGAQVLPPDAYTASDCRGQTPIVVASDEAAQSDLYSALTLAAALSTTCVVLAGPRRSALPPQQRTRLRSAASGGWIVGGEAAVPGWKVAAYGLTRRLAGVDRWHTAVLVGLVANNPSIDIARATRETTPGGSSNGSTNVDIDELIRQADNAFDRRKVTRQALEDAECFAGQNDYKTETESITCLKLNVEDEAASGRFFELSRDIWAHLGCQPLRDYYNHKMVRAYALRDAAQRTVDTGDVTIWNAALTIYEASIAADDDTEFDHHYNTCFPSGSAT